MSYEADFLASADDEDLVGAFLTGSPDRFDDLDKDEQIDVLRRVVRLLLRERDERADYETEQRDRG